MLYGSDLYGRVDPIRGAGAQVATLFFHVMFVPLIPGKSYLVDSASVAGVGEREFQGKELPALDRRSVARGYLEGGILAVIVLATVKGALAFRGGATNTCLLAAGVVALGVAIYLGMRALLSREASFARAMELAEQADVGAEQRIAIEIAYERISAEEGLDRILQLRGERERKKQARRDEVARKRAAKRAKRKARENPALRAKAPKRRRRARERALVSSDR